MRYSSDELLTLGIALETVRRLGGLVSLFLTLI